MTKSQEVSPARSSACSAAFRETGRGRLTVVGSGALEPDVKRLADRLGIAMVFTGARHFRH